MFLSRVRRLPHLICVVGTAFLGWHQNAHAGANDLDLLNLCPVGTSTPPGLQQPECEWIQRDGSGVITGAVTPSDAAKAQFRSLMSELGVVAAPRLMTPADTLGFAGFQFSFELGVTRINPERRAAGGRYWDGTSGVSAINRDAMRPDSYITTVGGFVRKGLWIPLPAFEFGAGVLSILGSKMYTVQGYAKLALQEGFHGWALPSFAVRGSASQLLGTDQVDMVVYGVDVLASKAFSIGGTARLEPFVGWNLLFIDARSGVIDATPSCDAYLAQNAMPGGPAAGNGCAAAQNGNNWNDLNANFTFPAQDVITRQRWYGGLKLKLSVLFMAVQVDVALAGSSRDGSPVGNADRSGRQETYSLAIGLDF
jgi:hypothetical protein